MTYNKNITIKITPLLRSGMYDPYFSRRSISLSDSNKLTKSQMEYTLYHEYFHHAQARFRGFRLPLMVHGYGDRFLWLIEGSADWMTDVIADGLNEYSAGGDIMAVGLDANPNVQSVNGSHVESAGNPYNRSTFFMLLARKCNQFKTNMPNMFGNVPLSFGVEVPFTRSGIEDLNQVIIDSDCDFGKHVGDERAPKLAAAIAFYNYGFLFKKDMRLFDSDASRSYTSGHQRGFAQLHMESWPNVLTTARDFPLVTNDLSLHGSRPVHVDVIPSAGAFSFELPYDYIRSPDGTVTELPDGTVAELIVNPSRGQELIVSVTCLRSEGCRTDENRQAFNDLNTIGEARDLHTWFSTVDTDSHVLARDRLPGMYITIVNPSLSEDVDVEILFRLRQETEITAQPAFTSHNDGDIVRNRVVTVSGIFPEEVRDEISRVVVTANGLRSETVMRSDGAFREQIIMFAGDNIITAQGFSGETPVTQAARINLRGEQSRNLGARNQLVPSRVGFVLRWDTSNTDVDIHSTDKYSRTIYFRNRVQYPGFLDFDDLRGYGPEVISYRALEHDIYRNGTFEVDIHLYSSRGTAATNFTLDVILNETEADSRRLHRYKSVTPLTPANTWFGDILKISCSRDGVCQVNSIDESKLASIGTTGSSGEANASSEASASGRCSVEGACEVNSVEGAKGDPTSPAKTDIPSDAFTGSRSGPTPN